MTGGPVVGLIDGALAADRWPVVAAACFAPGGSGRPGQRHAEAIAGSIASHARARFRNAVMFGADLSVPRAALCEALRWLLAEPPDILHCSFGYRTSDPDLAALFAEAVRRCRAVVAAAPARGAPVYPAAYPGVIAVQGDARCGPDEWSWLGTGQADFGAHVVAAGDPAVRGASAAAAHFTGILCARLGTPDPFAALRRDAAWIGPERRVPAG